MPYQAGDILFFNAPPQPNQFTKIAMKAQWFLSCLSCTCCTEEHKKTHAAICTAVTEDKSGNQEVTIAHFNSKTYEYEQTTLTELSRSLKNRQIDILRPKNTEFAKSLVATITSEEAQRVRLDNNSMKQSLFCCASTAIEKTKSGFSLQSHCSRFIAEAIEITSRDYEYKPYSFNNANVTVMRLWQRLNATKLYEPISPSSTEEITSQISKHPIEKQYLLLR